MSVRLTRKGDELEAGEPRTLFQLPPSTIGADVTHDGQRILVTYSVAEAQARRARVILDRTALTRH